MPCYDYVPKVAQTVLLSFTVNLEIHVALKSFDFVLMRRSFNSLVC